MNQIAVHSPLEITCLLECFRQCIFSIDRLMDPRTPHHKVCSNGCACLNYIWEWSIHYCSLSAMFTPLHSSTNQKLFEKHVCNHNSYYEKYDGTVRPSYCLKLKYPLPSLSGMFDSLHCSTNQEVFEKNLCNKSSHYEKYARFLVTQRSHHVQLLN